MDLQRSQLGTMDGNGKEASDGCGTGVFGTRLSEAKIPHLREGHSELGDTIVVQFEGALAVVAFLMTVDP